MMLLSELFKTYHMYLAKILTSKSFLYSGYSYCFYIFVIARSEEEAIYLVRRFMDNKIEPLHWFQYICHISLKQQSERDISGMIRNDSLYTCLTAETNLETFDSFPKLTELSSPEFTTYTLGNSIYCYFTFLPSNKEVFDKLYKTVSEDRNESTKMTSDNSEKRNFIVYFDVKYVMSEYIGVPVRAFNKDDAIRLAILYLRYKYGVICTKNAVIIVTPDTAHYYSEEEINELKERGN